jgi:hypothetical protein
VITIRTAITTGTADIIAGDHSTTAIFATSIAAATIAVMSITDAASTGTDGARAACSIMASFAWWCWP